MRVLYGFLRRAIVTRRVPRGFLTAARLGASNLLDSCNENLRKELTFRKYALNSVRCRRTCAIKLRGHVGSDG
jgi:hypothetical protein